MFERLSKLSLTTERLSIRALVDSDLKAIYAIHSDDSVNQYLPYETWQNWDDAKHWFARVQQRRAERMAEQYVIERLDDQQLIGTCIVFAHNQQQGSIEFGYVLASDHWNKGYMTEALNAFVPELARTLSLRSVTAAIESENAASLKLIYKLGFKECGREKDGSAVLIHFLRVV